MSPPAPASAPSVRGARRRLAAGAGVLLAAIPLAIVAGKIQRANPDRPELAVQLVALVFVSLFAAVVGGYLIRHRGGVDPARLGFVAVSVAVGLAVAAYLVWALGQQSYRADILIWSESPFVNDIIKARTGIPIYSAPSDLNSFFYTPGSQLLTYALAALAGKATSIPVYRLVQLGYVAVAALLGTRAVRLLRTRTGAAPDPDLPWEVLWVPLLFLFGTNELTNPFNHLLHNDALALLVSTAGYLLLVEYALERRARTLVLMALIPLLGFAVKQSLAIWFGLYLGYLVCFDQPRSVRRIVAFGMGAGGLLLLGYGVGRAIWGGNFHYWTVTVMGNHPPSILRVVQHVLDTWVYWVAGLAGGLLLLGTNVSRPALGLWLVWLLLLTAEAYTSGIAWMINHLGPGSMIAGIWLCAALPQCWPANGPAVSPARAGPVTWLRTAAAVGIALLCLAGLRLIRVPLPGLPPDAERYAAAIEAEFEGTPADRVLLDSGSWPYLEAGVVMRDRSAVVGELGVTETGDLSGLFERLRTQHYRRILLRDLETADFPYDHGLWRVSSGVRDSLQAYYQVVRRIPAVTGTRTAPIGLREISVLEPRRP